MEELIKRINQIMSELGYSRPSQFADKVGLSRSNFSQMMRGNRVIGEGVINKICLHLNIDKNWILTGEGDMIKSNINKQDTVKERLKEFLRYSDIKAIDFCKAINVSQGFISSMRESIQPDKLRNIAINYPQLNIEWLIIGTGEMLKESTEPSNSNKTVNFNDHRSGESIHNKPVSREEYEELRSKYLNSLEENIRLRNQIDEMREQKIKA